MQCGSMERQSKNTKMRKTFDTVKRKRTCRGVVASSRLCVDASSRRRVNASSRPHVVASMHDAIVAYTRCHFNATMRRRDDALSRRRVDAPGWAHWLALDWICAGKPCNSNLACAKSNIFCAFFRWCFALFRGPCPSP